MALHDIMKETDESLALEDAAKLLGQQQDLGCRRLPRHNKAKACLQCLIALLISQFNQYPAGIPPVYPRILLQAYMVWFHQTNNARTNQTEYRWVIHLQIIFGPP